MMKMFLAAGVAALAMSVPTAAQPGKGERGGGRDKAQVQKVERGGGQARAQRGERPQVERRGNARQQQQRAERGKAERKQAARGHAGRRAEARERAAERRSRGAEQARERRARANEQVRERHSRMAEQARDRRDRQLERTAERRREALRDRNRDVRRLAEQRREALRDRNVGSERLSDWRRDELRERSRRLERIADQRRDAIRSWDDWDDRVAIRSNGWVDGCPPGLAKKPVACVPPGLARSLVGQRFDDVQQRIDFRDLPDRLRYVYPDTDDYYYRYGNGYAYRVDRESQLINALLPLFGLGVTVGQPFPTAYNSSNYYLPTGLQPFYNHSPYDYRYANGYVYEIDPMTGLVADVDPMLGYGYGYGQMLPTTYSAYNVPYQYRPYYQDTADHYYRYAPGAIYRVDSGSGLIDAVSALLTGGMAVGQPLPMGYDVYNVPLGYRDQYYDTADNWYRYSDGYIYQVDPTTRLVTAIVQALT